MNNNIPYSPEQHDKPTPVGGRLRITQLSGMLVDTAMLHIPVERVIAGPLAGKVELETETTPEPINNQQMEEDAQRKINAIFN